MCEAAPSAVASASVTPVGNCPRPFEAGSFDFEDTLLATVFPSIVGETCVELTPFAGEGPLVWVMASLALGLAMGAPTGLGESLLPDGEPAFPSVSPSFRDVSEGCRASATSCFGAAVSLIGAFCGAWVFISPCERGGAETAKIADTSATALRCSGNPDVGAGAVLVSIVPTLCTPSRAGSLVSAVGLEGAGETAIGIFRPCSAGITMVAMPLVAFCFGISAEGAGIGLLSPDGVGKTDAATGGLIVRVKKSVGGSAALMNSGGAVTGGGTAGVDVIAGATSVEDAAAGSDLPAVADVDDIFVVCSPGVTVVAIRFAGFPRGISFAGSAIGSLLPDGVGTTGARTSGLGFDIGATLFWSGDVFKGSGGIETDGGRGGLGGSAEATSGDEEATGSNFPTRLESEPEIVCDPSPTGNSGTNGKNAGNGTVSKILPLGSGTTPVGGTGTSGVSVGEGLDDFVPLFVFPLVAAFPRSIAPRTFGLADMSGALPLAAAKAEENFPDGATLPTDAFAGVAFTATVGKLTITGSPSPRMEDARRSPERFRLETLPACELGARQLKSFHACAD